MIDYPENFPQPSTNLSGDVESPTIRTQLDNGLVEQASRYSSGLESFSASWEVDAAELLMFEEWFNETLAGGVLVFGLALPDDGAYSIQPVRFVGGTYNARHKSALWFTITARLERLVVNDAPANRTLPVPQWLRLAVDPTLSQNLTLAHRNGILTVRPDDGSQTTLRIYPPTDATQYIYFGINNQGLGETLITSEDVDPIPAEAVPDFPGDLPNINQSFGEDGKRKTTRIEMDSGHPRQYAGLETTVKMYDVEWDFNLDQLQTFQDFFFITLKNGQLAFMLTLPVDGVFLPVAVRFVGGKYAESYLPVDTFKVSAKLERIVDQTVIPSPERPFPVWYSPTVNVTVNRKIFTADANKFFVVSPAEGQTISLHIYSRLIEFGILVKGLGNVLITREGFIEATGGFDEAESEYLKPSFELRDSIREISALADFAQTTYIKPTFEFLDLLVDLGSLELDEADSQFLKPELELKTVLEDVGEIEDYAATTYLKPTFELAIP